MADKQLVWVVSDNEDTLSLENTALRHNGYNVLKFRTAEGAKVKLETLKPSELPDAIVAFGDTQSPFAVGPALALLEKAKTLSDVRVTQGGKSIALLLGECDLGPDEKSKAVEIGAVNEKEFSSSPHAVVNAVNRLLGNTRPRSQVISL